MNSDTLNKLVNRFLSWPLPGSICSDACASISGYPNRTGTTLLTATEAGQMIEHVTSPLLEEIDQLRGRCAKLLEVIVLTRNKTILWPRGGEVSLLRDINHLAEFALTSYGQNVGEEKK